MDEDEFVHHVAHMERLAALHENLDAFIRYKAALKETGDDTGRLARQLEGRIRGELHDYSDVLRTGIGLPISDRLPCTKSAEV